MDNPVRLNNFAMGLRELSRIVLHDLAPDAGLAEEFVENTLLVDVEETISEFRDLVETPEQVHAHRAVDIQYQRGCSRRSRQGGAKDAVDDELLETTVQELDQIAIRYQVDGCNIDNLKLVEMNATTIKFELHGSVDSQL